MTEGRFETTWNCRPPGWDNRHFWAKTHHKSCSDEHLEKEAAPYHDLRASGCFQPETGMSYGSEHTIQPDKLTARPSGNGMRTASAGHLPKHLALGGDRFPLDVDASAVPAKTARKVSSKPWTSAHVSIPPLDDAPPASSPVKGAARAASAPAPPPCSTEPFRAGAKGAWGHNFPHLPDASDPSKASLARPVFRLRTGRPADSRSPSPRSKSPPKQKAMPRRRPPSVPRQVFSVNKPLLGTFAPVAPHLPDPWSQGSLKQRTCSLFTYHAQSKRQMPVMVPWSTGLATVDVR